MLVLGFSKNRALQLDGMLRSLEQCCGPVRSRVIYEATDELHAVTYSRLAREYPRVSLVAQGDFERQVRRELETEEYVLLVVDDTMFINDCSLLEAAALLRHDEVFGALLYLSKDTRESYMGRCAQAVPRMTSLANRWCCYEWMKAEGDFAYPLSVNCSAYRCEDLLTCLRGRRFRDPCELELVIDHTKGRVSSSRSVVVVPTSSSAFSLPLNRVANSCPDNRAANRPGTTPESLRRWYAGGWRVAVDLYRGCVPGACHLEIPLIVRRGGEFQVLF
jgi:hypothetical protein